MPHWVAQVWFLVFGALSGFLGAVLLTDFRGWGRQWEDRLNARNAYVGRLLQPPNPYIGPVWRPATGLFATLLGIAMVAAVVSGAMR